MKDLGNRMATFITGLIGAHIWTSILFILIDMLKMHLLTSYEILFSVALLFLLLLATAILLITPFMSDNKKKRRKRR